MFSPAVVPRVLVRCLLTAAGPLHRRRWCGFSSLRMAGEPLPALGTTKFPVVDPSRPRPLLLECLSSAPASAGCYIMQAADGRKLYIGKSVRLSSRVPSYFSTTDDGSVFPGGNLSRRIAVMTTLVERSVVNRLVQRIAIILRSQQQQQLQGTSLGTPVSCVVRMKQPSVDAPTRYAVTFH